MNSFYRTFATERKLAAMDGSRPANGTVSPTYDRNFAREQLQKSPRARELQRKYRTSRGKLSVMVMRKAPPGGDPPNGTGDHVVSGKRRHQRRTSRARRAARGVDSL
jgi:hypothetical protein